MLELRIIVGGKTIPIVELPAVWGERAAAKEIADQVETLIGVLDTLGGDPDLEEDDHAGDPLDDGEDENWRPEGYMLLKPEYGVDQSTGPVNEQAVSADWHRHLQGAR